MPASSSAPRFGSHSVSSATVAARAVEVLGGRYSMALGIDVDRGERELERWALAATLFGARISAEVAQRTFGVFEAAGIHTIDQAGRCEIERLIELLDTDGYARYDLRTAERLHAIADTRATHGHHLSALLSLPSRERDPALRALPGWGPVTVALFLRELRGVYAAIEPPLDPRAASAAEHLGLVERDEPDPLARLRRLARSARLDVRDLEAALVRLSLAHRRHGSTCPGGRHCTLLASV